MQKHLATLLKKYYNNHMTANTATNKGIYLGKGISPFPKLHAFAENKDGSNKIFSYDLKGVFEIDSAKLAEKMQAETQAKASFFQAYPNTPLD